jgi:hypothetical protein
MLIGMRVEGLGTTWRIDGCWMFNDVSEAQALAAHGDVRRTSHDPTLELAITFILPLPHLRDHRSAML